MAVTTPGAAPYPTVNSVLNVARARVGDMLDSVDGTLLTNDANYTQTYVDAAWMWYQDRCNNAGVELQIKEVLVFGVMPRGTNDTGFPCFVGWAGNGNGLAEYDTPALPLELVNPLSVWRRQSGVQGNFDLMRQAVDGLPVWLDTSVYDWRTNAMYFYGEQYAQDFRIRYSQYWPMLQVSQPNAIVPMLGCQDCLGARIAFEYASARGAVAAPQMAAWAEEAFKETAQRTSRRKQRQSIRRVGYSGNGYCSTRPWPVIH